MASSNLAWLLVLAAACTSALGASGPHRQVPFAYPPAAIYNDVSSAFVNDDDPSQVPAIRLSHSGLYINQAHAPSAIHRPNHGNETDMFQPQPLVVYLDPELYHLDTVIARLGPVNLRTRDEVMLKCGNHAGGIESCQADDLRADEANVAAEVLLCRPDQKSLKQDGRFLLDQHSCPGWSDFWQHPENLRGESELLKSFVVNVNVAKNDGDQPDGQRFWIGHLHLNQSRASWPLAGNARARRPGQDDRTWHPDDVNRISGAMENPSIPRSALLTSDRNFGVYVDQSGWTLGVQIRVPLTITNPRDDEGDDDDDEDPDKPHHIRSNLFLPPEEVFAPVAGQVVWSRGHTFKRPPLFGPAAGKNDEESFCFMIRDEWSIVYQIFGIDPSTISVQEGDVVARGDVLGHAMREGLSLRPPSTTPPADHALSKPDKHTPYYPHRFRKLEVRIARPDASWTEWKGPDALGWQYFHPLHVFREGKTYRSSIPPYGSPTVLYFATPSSDPLNTPPNAFATSNDYFTPSLSGRVEIIAGFEYFQQTPGDSGDGMDPLAIYALDVAFRKKNQGDREPQRGMECDLGGDADPVGVTTDPRQWLNVFEHSKLPNAWTDAFADDVQQDDPESPLGAATRWRSKLFSHYMPAFSHGRFFPDKITSQFDEKDKRLYYSASRTLRGEPKINGAIDVTRVTEDQGGPGKYRVVVRARDYWGNHGCLGTDVWLS